MPEPGSTDAYPEGIPEILGNPESKTLALAKFGTTVILTKGVIANRKRERCSFSAEAVDGPVQLGAEGRGAPDSDAITGGTKSCVF